MGCRSASLSPFLGKSLLDYFASNDLHLWLLLGLGLVLEPMIFSELLFVPLSFGLQMGGFLSSKALVVLTGGSVTNVATGAVQEVLFTVKSQGPRSVHRKALLEALAEELLADSIQFSSKFTSIEQHKLGDASIVVLHLEDGTTIKSKVYIYPSNVHVMSLKLTQ
ncbi:hypothetical protein GH714_021036 [Hevea brasiliensis]|uniref:Uncharacterized protein n=1 Tax=Hevea brasiliensis TaxID=3981 RepID=A0A6A6K8I1_HEVBR|nr:hypothetical protein GH714_021036 [Hevea brasiliensis]